MFVTNIVHVMQALAVDFAQRTGLNNKDVFSVVKAPRNMQYVHDTMQRMERGDLKVHVSNVVILVLSNVVILIL